MRGDEAAVLLGDRLPEVARWYGMPEARFREILRSDRTVRLDRNGRVFFEDDAPVPAAAATSASTSISTTATAPLDQTFKLHSKPDASRVVYLDFNGATLTGTAWNTETGLQTIDARPYDLDGDPNSFSATELTQIQNIWQRVAEDFSPFNVDVTTEQPTDSALTRSSSGDDTFGTTVLITRRTFYNCNCGGVAYLTVFDDIGNFYKPALVFFDMLFSFEKYIAEAISHEAGHNVGLSHDGVLAHDGFAAIEYYEGHGAGATGWAPIMGSGYSRELVQWSKGEYANANNTQNDFSVMQMTGLPLRPDDHGGSFATATDLAQMSSSTLLTGAGIIESQSDFDIFRFSAGAGAVSIQVLPAPRSPNLDVLATLQRSDGTVLASSNPVLELSANFGVTLPAPATLFLTVQGTGKGNPATDGYSSYGSVGQYSIRIQRALQSTSVSLSASSSQIDPGQTETLTATVSGLDPTGEVSFYDNGVLIGTATLVNGIATFTTPPLSFGVHSFTATYNGSGVNLSSSSTVPTVVMSGNVAAIISIITSILLDD